MSWCISCFRKYQRKYHLSHKVLKGTRDRRKQNPDDYTPTEELTRKANVAAWAAGFVDGEGSFSIIYQKSLKYNCFSVVACACQNDIRPLFKLKEHYGGTIMKMNRDDAYRWHVYGFGLTRFLKEMIPFLVVKKEEALLCLKFREILERRNGGRIPEDELKERFGILEEYKMLRESKKSRTLPAMNGFLN